VNELLSMITDVVVFYALGLFAAFSSLVRRRPNPPSSIDAIVPYQGWLSCLCGTSYLYLGVLRVLTYGAFGALKVSFGVMFGYLGHALLTKHGEQMRPYQTSLALWGIVFAVCDLAWPAPVADATIRMTTNDINTNAIFLFFLGGMAVGARSIAQRPYAPRWFDFPDLNLRDVMLCLWSIGLFFWDIQILFSTAEHLDWPRYEPVWWITFALSATLWFALSLLFGYAPLMRLAKGEQVRLSLAPYQAKLGNLAVALGMVSFVFEKLWAWAGPAGG
jgi:hypothetical protein